MIKNDETFEEIMTDYALLVIDAGNAASDDATDELVDDFNKIVHRLRAIEGDYAELIADAEGVLMTLLER